MLTVDEIKKIASIKINKAMPSYRNRLLITEDDVIILRTCPTFWLCSTENGPMVYVHDYDHY